jgi:hypothetical protein
MLNLFLIKMKIMSQYCPPTVLVKTWLLLINSRSSDEARVRAKKMINLNFGSVDLATIYLEQSHSDNTLVKVGMCHRFTLLLKARCRY